MAAHAWILLEVTAVIVKQDILEPTVKQVITTLKGSFEHEWIIKRYIRSSLQKRSHDLQWTIRSTFAELRTFTLSLRLKLLITLVEINYPLFLIFR